LKIILYVIFFFFVDYVFVQRNYIYQLRESSIKESNIGFVLKMISIIDVSNLTRLDVRPPPHGTGTSTTGRVTQANCEGPSGSLLTS